MNKLQTVSAPSPSAVSQSCPPYSYVLARLCGHRANLMGMVGIAGLYLLLALAITQVMHFSRAFDEGYHLDYITFIKQQGRLPVTYQERAQITRADFPPLYHLLVALFSANVSVDAPPDFKVFWDSFRYRAIDHQSDTIWTLDTTGNGI